MSGDPVSFTSTCPACKRDCTWQAIPTVVGTATIPTHRIPCCQHIEVDMGVEPLKPTYEPRLADVIRGVR
jgi:hypothetical protein